MKDAIKSARFYPHNRCVVSGTWWNDYVESLGLGSSHSVATPFNESKLNRLAARSGNERRFFSDFCLGWMGCDGSILSHSNNRRRVIRLIVPYDLRRVSIKRWFLKGYRKHFKVRMSQYHRLQRGMKPLTYLCINDLESIAKVGKGLLPHNNDYLCATRSRNLQLFSLDSVYHPQVSGFRGFWTPFPDEEYASFDHSQFLEETGNWPMMGDSGGDNESFINDAELVAGDWFE